MIAQTTTPPRFLTPEESFRLFTHIWHHDQDASQARETLIHHNLRAIRTFLLKLPALYWYDEEDISQEAYVLLASSIEKVPPFIPDPGPYLYKTACTNFRRSLAPFEHQPESLDAILPGTENATLYDFLATPPPRSASTIQATLFAALHRLPINQQEKLHEFFQMPDFQPRANTRGRGSLGHRPKSTKAGTHGTARSEACQELRQDSDLRQAVEPRYRHWTRSPSKTLKYYRLLHGYTQRRIAEALHVSQSLVGLWEKGTHHPSGSHREQLCHLYGVNAEQLGLKER